MKLTTEQKNNLNISRLYTGMPFSEYDPKTDEMKFLLTKNEPEDVRIFNNPAFGELRTVKFGDEIWFVAKDIADTLGYSDTNKMVSRLDSDESMSSKMEDTKMLHLFINESGLYNAIFGSKKPEAKAFKKWVTSVVLPDIRKTGMFLLDNYFMDKETQKHGLNGYSHLREPMELQRFIATYDLDACQLIWDMVNKGLIDNALDKNDVLKVNLASFKNLSFSATAIGCGAAWHDKVFSLCQNGRPMVNPVKLCKILKYHVENKLITTISKNKSNKKPLFKDYAFGTIN
ncbi:MAG: Bro-N domain-containing protein [Desulfamplus sp.]|nr:Bro-N domain-containing protein [Desulfamplus sp.]